MSQFKPSSTIRPPRTMRVEPPRAVPRAASSSALLEPPVNALPPAVAREEAGWQAAENNQLRRLAFLGALIYIVFRTSFLHEILTERFGSIYFYPLLGMPVIMLAFASGAFQRMLSETLGRVWLLFAGWLALAALLSTWKSDSAMVWLGYLQVSLSAAMIMAGLTLTLSDCRKMIGAVIFGGGLSAFAVTFLVNVDRSGSDFTGSFGNANDLAAHFLFVIPLLLCAALTAKLKIIRAVAVVAIGIAFVQSAQSGSRGAMVAIAVVFLFLLIKGSAAFRITALVGAPLGLMLAVMLLPGTLLQRYATTFGSNETAKTSEAVASTEDRMYLLRTSVNLTLQYPLFGVGPSQFANVEGNNARSEGRHGAWQVTHNAYTQISSEAGIPGFLIFVSAIFLTYRTLMKIRKDCRAYGKSLPQLEFFSTAAFCMTISLIGFAVAIIFLAQGYAIYLPMLSGLTAAMNRAVGRELQLARPVLARRPAMYVRAS